MSQKLPKLILYTFMLALTFASWGFSILSKFISTMKSKGENFNHPFFIPISMVIGDALLIFIYLYEIHRAKKKFGSYQLHPKVMKARTKGRSSYVNPLNLIPPRIFNLLGSCLLAISFSFSSISENPEIHHNTEIFGKFKRNMDVLISGGDNTEKNDNSQNAYITFELALALQGNFILIIALISFLYLKKKQYKHHILGILMILIAVWMISIPLYIEENGSVWDILIGTGMILGSVTLFSLQFNLEERLINKYFISPARMVGWEGIWGLIFMAIILPSFQFVSWSTHFCRNNILEDSVFALNQIGSNFWILLCIIGMIILSSVSNILGVTVMKYTCGNSRVSLLILRLLPTWVFFILFKGEGHQNINYVQLAGYVILCIGTIVYNEIIVFPWFGLNLNTRDQIDIHNQETESISDEELTMSKRSSIHYNINI